jgi:HlyD family secretion protein
MATKKKNNTTRNVLLGIGGFILLIVVLKLTGVIGGEKKTEIETESVQKRTIISKISESGTIEADIEVPVAPDVSGEIVELPVKEGDYVKAGQLLMVIRPDNYKAALEQTTASLNSAKSDYEQSKANRGQSRSNFIQDSINYVRYKLLYEQKVVSKTEFETFELKYKISRSQAEAAEQTINSAYYRIKSSEASVKQARENLSRTSIYASMNGTITKLSAELGQRVVGTGQMAGTEIMKVSDLRQMEVSVPINENDIVNLQVGDSANVEVDAFPDKIFHGHVKEIAYAPNVQGQGSTDQITTFKVKVLIDRKSYENDPVIMKGIDTYQSPFRPGMTSQVEIFTETKENVISVPMQSVTIDINKTDKEKAENEVVDRSTAKEIVYIYDKGKVKKVNVKTGLSDDQFIEITEGLAEGQIIVSGPYRVITKELKDGMEVSVKEKKKTKPDKKDSAE